MENNERLYLTTAPVKKLLVKFAIPCILAMLVSALYNIVDQIFIGHSNAGVSGIMATTLVFPFTVVALAVAQLLGDGCAALFSISLGSKDEKTANKAVGNTIVAVLALSVLLVILGFLVQGPILKLLGAGNYDNRCQEYTKQYYHIILCGLPFFMFTSASASIIRASGAPGYSMVSTLIGAIINLILDPILIFGLKMEIRGAAIATIVGQVVSALVAAWYFRKPKLMKLSLESFKVSGKVLSKSVKLGLSSFVTQASIAIITIVCNNVVGSIAGVNATDAGGALGIVFKVFAIVLAFSLGIAVGGQPIIGFNYGAGKMKRVLETYKYVLIGNIIVGVVATLLFELAPGYIVKMFGGNANNLEFYQAFAKKAFRIYLGGIALCCIQKSGCIYLQSINKPYKAMILSLMRDVIILVPGVCILGLCFDLDTMLLAGPVADVGSFIVTVIFIVYECNKIKHMNKEVKEESHELNTSHYIISIGREFGSGGKYIGEEVAKRLNIKCYDRELVEGLSQNTSIDIATLDELDEKQKQSFWYSLALTNTNQDDNMGGSVLNNLFLKQSKVIEDIASNEDCVMIGRCSNYILKGQKNLISVFIYANDPDFKISRKKLTDLPHAEALKILNEEDKKRSDYYNIFTSLKWGNKESYDICLDSSKLGVEKTIEYIVNYVNLRKTL